MCTARPSLAGAVVTGPEWRRTSRRALFLACVSAAARGPGFLIPLVIATVFGAGPQTDAYFLVYSAALVVGATLGQGIEVAIVPHVARVWHEEAGGIKRYLARGAREAGTAAAVAWMTAVPLVLLNAAPDVRSGLLAYCLAFTPLAIL